MRRRKFLKKVGVGDAVAGTAVNTPAVIAKKTYRWKMVTTWPPKLPVLQTGCERLAKRIGELSGGRLQIQVFAGGELVQPFGSFDAVSNGTVEVLAEESQKDAMTKKVSAAFSKFQKIVGIWGSVSEKAYYNIIQPRYSLKG